MRNRDKFCGALVALLVLCSACSSRSDRPDLGRVTGKVTVAGEPLANVEIDFAPETGRPSYGRTNDDGVYELEYLSNVKGAKVGRHTVTVRSSRVDNSRLEPVEVKAGSNVIDLKCEPGSPDKANDSNPES